MCSNVEKARFLKILVEEIRAAAASRRARKTPRPVPSQKGWMPGGARPALVARQGK